MKNAVCFAYAKDQLPVDSRLPDRGDLFDVLKARDLQPFVSLGAEKSFQEISVRSYALDPQSTIEQRPIPYEELGVIVNRLDRSIKKELVPAALLPPAINENEVRKIGYHKERAASEVLDPLGYGIPTSLIASADDITAFLDTTHFDEYFLKPRHGKFGNGTRVLARHAVRNYFEDNTDHYDKYILQPAFDFSAAFPSDLKAFDTATSEDYERLSSASFSKELRMYGFYSPSGTAVFPAARAVDISGDERKHTSKWFFVDPDSIPQKVVERTHAIINRTSALTGSVALYGAVDFGFGTADKSDHDWHVIELNALAPGMISNDQNKTVASKLRNLFADQIQSTTESVT